MHETLKAAQKMAQIVQLYQGQNQEGLSKLSYGGLVKLETSLIRLQDSVKL